MINFHIIKKNVIYELNRKMRVEILYMRSKASHRIGASSTVLVLTRDGERG